MSRTRLRLQSYFSSCLASNKFFSDLLRETLFGPDKVVCFAYLAGEQLVQLFTVVNIEG